MNKIEEIFKSWGISVNPNEEQSKLAFDRIEICNTCEFKKEGVINTCSVCGCALKAKVFSPVKGACPKGKWDEIDNTFNLQNNVVHSSKEKKLRFVCAQPATTYYAWQVEVMLNNFIEMGVNLNNVDIVCWKPDGIVSQQWTNLAENYAARFFFYNDIRKTKNYISSIRPNILKQHFRYNKEIKNDVIFYHDCDILFTKPISDWITKEMIEDDIWYGSDTRWYISHSYIVSKGHNILEKMCEIVNIDSKIVESNELNSIGAQYLMKGIDEHYWHRVETHSERLYKEITELNKEIKKENPSYHELQIWCADMWAVLWNAWKMGKETKCSPNMQFSWATSGIHEIEKYNIFHNAGVTVKNTDLFNKSKYTIKLPYGEDIDVRENSASSYYWSWIKKVGSKSVLK